MREKREKFFEEDKIFLISIQKPIASQDFLHNNGYFFNNDEKPWKL